MVRAGSPGAFQRATHFWNNASWLPLRPPGDFALKIGQVSSFENGKDQGGHTTQKVLCLSHPRIPKISLTMTCRYLAAAKPGL